jgi:hypothetical protein
VTPGLRIALFTAGLGVRDFGIPRSGIVIVRKPCVAIGCLLTGCGLLGGVQVEPVALSVQRPSNVAVYLSVTDKAEPVTDLELANFSIFENDQPVPSSDARLTLLDRDLAAVHHTLLLLDMSGVTDEPARRALASGVRAFAGKIRHAQGVSIFAFDGSEAITPIAEFPREARADGGSEELDTLARFTPKDSSRNLYGAIVEGLKELDVRLMAVKKPVRLGTLVVYTRGPDLAGRAGEDDIYNRLEQSGHDVFAIGVGEEDSPYLRTIGRTGIVKSQTQNTVAIALEEAGQKVDSAHDRFYMLSYCSPARAGTRRLRVEVGYTSVEGDQKKGSLEQDFDATGFGPGCDPQSPPRFVVGGADTGEAVPEPEPPPAEPEAEKRGSRNGAPTGKSSSKPGGSEAGPAAKSDDDAIVPPPEKPTYKSK